MSTKQDVKNIGLEMDKFLTQLLGYPPDGEDGLCNGECSMRWDFDYDKTHFTVHLVTNPDK